MIWNFVGRPARKLLFGGEGYGFRGTIEGAQPHAAAFVRAEWYVMMLPIIDAARYVESQKAVPLSGVERTGLAVAVYRPDAGRVEVTAGLLDPELDILRAHYMQVMASPWLLANLMFVGEFAGKGSMPGRPDAEDFERGAALLMQPQFGFDIIEKGASA